MQQELGILLGRASEIDRMRGVFQEDWDNAAALTYDKGVLGDPFWVNYATQ
ncbi:MAG: hypothetical protein ACKOE2_10445 [Actinomycetales bacterium]